MHDSCDHQPAPRGGDGIGIPRDGAFDAAAFERAIADLLTACGLPTEGVHTGQTPRRVRELWQRRLLGGYALDPAQVLGSGFEDAREDMVVVRGIAIHGVCPSVSARRPSPACSSTMHGCAASSCAPSAAPAPESAVHPTQRKTP